MSKDVKINDQNTTFCVGYWHVKERSSKKSIEHYLKYMPETFKLLKNQKIIFYYDDESILESVKKYLETSYFIEKKINLINLPTYEISENYLKSCSRQDFESLININSLNEKGLVHYKRDFIESGSNCYRKLFTIWTSKILLLEEAINSNDFNTSFFAWADFSISRFKQKRENWNFINQVFCDNYIYHFDSVMRYYGKKLNLNASFLFGHKKLINELSFIFKNSLEELKNSNYAHDEETIIETFYEKHNLFKKINEWKNQ